MVVYPCEQRTPQKDASETLITVFKPMLCAVLVGELLDKRECTDHVIAPILFATLQ